ncbi:MAG: hypothetical protein QNJ20_07885 [Paracoccaceae bacterium]|nr:hypothetical protein [Paracoccaceae bacterium]
MYVRFETFAPCAEARGHTSIFQAALDLWQDVDRAESWQADALRRELDWFNEHLDAPETNAFWYRPNRKAEVSGLCWFRDSAEQHVSRARFMAWLLDELAVPTRALWACNPGRILWADNVQVIAAPALG